MREKGDEWEAEKGLTLTHSMLESSGEARRVWGCVQRKQERKKNQQHSEQRNGREGGWIRGNEKMYIWMRLSFFWGFCCCRGHRGGRRPQKFSNTESRRKREMGGEREEWEDLHLLNEVVVVVSAAVVVMGQGGGHWVVSPGWRNFSEAVWRNFSEAVWEKKLSERLEPIGSQGLRNLKFNVRPGGIGLFF